MKIPYPSATQRSGRGLTTWLWLGAAATALAFLFGTFTVREGEVAIVAHFGDPSRVVEEPGLHFKWPAPVDAVYTIDMRTHVLDPAIKEVLTNDKKAVDVDAFVAWRVADPMRFLTSMRTRTGAETKLKNILQSSLIKVMGRGPFEDIVSLETDRGRDLASIRREATLDVQESCAAGAYGIEIEMVGIERVTFPGDNKSFVENAMRSERDSEARMITAAAAEERTGIETDAKREEQRIKYEAAATATTMRSKGVSEAKRIDAESRELNPALYDLMADHEAALAATGGNTIIFDQDFWLMKIFGNPNAAADSTKASTEGDQ